MGKFGIKITKSHLKSENGTRRPNGFMKHSSRQKNKGVTQLVIPKKTFYLFLQLLVSNYST